MTPAQLTSTEDKLVQLWEEGSINSLIHFAGSTDLEYEAWLCRMFQPNVIGPSDWVLCSHRAHFHYLLYTYYQAHKMNGYYQYSFQRASEDLIEKVKSGRSMFLYGRRFIQSAIVGGLCGVAAGLAMSIKARGGKNRVWLFGGDGMADQGSFFEAVNLAHGRDLPVTFLVESNNRQCGVSRQQRQVKDWQWPPCVVWHEYSPKYPHAGTGGRPELKSQQPPTWLSR